MIAGNQLYNTCSCRINALGNYKLDFNREDSHTHNIPGLVPIDDKKKIYNFSVEVLVKGRMYEIFLDISA